MQLAALTTAPGPATDLHRGVAWLCGIVLFLEGYDIAAVGYAIPSLVDAWKVQPSAFTQVLTLGNIGLMIGSLCAGDCVAERVGFEPTLPFRVNTLSKRAPSATRPSLRQRLVEGTTARSVPAQPQATRASRQYHFNSMDEAVKPQPFKRMGGDQSIRK